MIVIVLTFKRIHYWSTSKMNLTVVYPLKGKVGGIEGPLSVELDCLGVREFVRKARASWPGCEKRRGLKSHHGPREEAQGASVHLEPLKNVC